MDEELKKLWDSKSKKLILGWPRSGQSDNLLSPTVKKVTYVFLGLVMDDSINERQLIRTSLFGPFNLFQAFVESMTKPAGN